MLSVPAGDAAVQTSKPWQGTALWLVALKHKEMCTCTRIINSRAPMQYGRVWNLFLVISRSGLAWKEGKMENMCFQTTRISLKSKYIDNEGWGFFMAVGAGSQRSRKIKLYVRERGSEQTWFCWKSGKKHGMQLNTHSYTELPSHLEVTPLPRGFSESGHLQLNYFERRCSNICDCTYKKQISCLYMHLWIIRKDNGHFSAYGGDSIVTAFITASMAWCQLIRASYSTKQLSSGNYLVTQQHTYWEWNIPF